MTRSSSCADNKTGSAETDPPPSISDMSIRHLHKKRDGEGDETPHSLQADEGPFPGQPEETGQVTSVNALMRQSQPWEG